MVTKIVAAALVAGGVTCGGMTSDTTEQPEVEFEVLGATQTVAQDSVSVATTRSGEATLMGVITTPSPCYQVTAELSADGQEMTLALDARALPRICAQVLTAFEYRARLYHLGSGTYAMTVTHNYPGTGWEARRYPLRVQIPQ